MGGGIVVQTKEKGRSGRARKVGQTKQTKEEVRRKGEYKEKRKGGE